MRALVVDDSRTMRRVIAGILVQLDCQTVEAENGQDALEQLECMETPDVALVDWNMPVMNGLDLVARLRADTRWSRLPIVMVTTETDVGMMVRALEVGADEYIMKPFTLDVMREKLELLHRAES